MAENAKIRTQSQQWAEKAFDRVSARQSYAKRDDYATFAKSFPALIHSCGLVQALAFAEAKGNEKGNKRGHTLEYLDDLATVVGIDREKLTRESREADAIAYLRLSREALAAAGWLKRYAEALLGEESGKGD